MEAAEERPDSDPLLAPLAAVASGEEADLFLSKLITTHAEPVIRAIIRYKLGFSSQEASQHIDAEDLHQESVLQLTSELQKFRQSPSSHPISDFRGLAAVIAHRACSRWMRRLFPERHALKNRLYYLLTHRRQFAAWRDKNGSLVAGRADWKSTDLAPRRSVLDTSRVKVETLESALESIFGQVRGPLEFDSLVAVLTPLFTIERRTEEPSESTMSPEPDPAWRAEKRIFLERLWEELRALPRHQRVALLLNLRDSSNGSSCIELFPITGVATMRQLASVLEMPAERLAELWNDLPIDDARIAELLQLTRQQVINARKSARERLTRQLRGFI
jgi:RNA polymerase sigma factor (sigma-70 family)